MSQPLQVVGLLCLALLVGLSSVASTKCDSDVAGCRDELSLMQTAKSNEVHALNTKAKAHAMIGEFKSKIGTAEGRGDLVQFGKNIVRMMNATDHLSVSDKSLLAEVTTLINEVLIGNIDGEYAANNALLVTASNEMQQCNDDLVVKNDTGSVGTRRDSTSAARTSHIQCRGQELGHYNQRVANTTALFDHIMAIEPVQVEVWQEAWQTNFDLVAIENYFTVNQAYVNWFDGATTAFGSVKGASETANSTHSAAQDDCDQKQGLFEEQYGLLSQVFNFSCGVHDACYDTKNDTYHTLLARLKVVEDHHKDAYKAAIIIVSKIECLLATNNCSDPTIDPNLYTLTEPTLPEPTECNMADISNVLCSNDFEVAEYASLDSNTPPTDCLTCHNKPWTNVYGLICSFFTESPSDCSNPMFAADAAEHCCACGGGNRF